MSENIRVNYICPTETENENRNGRNESIFVGNQATIIWLFQENEKWCNKYVYSYGGKHCTFYIMMQWVYIQWYFLIIQDSELVVSGKVSLKSFME